jgi:hypothetical protein
MREQAGAMSSAASPSERAIGYALLMYWPFTFALVFPLWVYPPRILRWPSQTVWDIALPTVFALGLAVLGYLAPWRRAAGWALAVGLTMSGFALLMMQASAPSGTSRIVTWMQLLAGLAGSIALCLVLEGLGTVARLGRLRWKRM